MTAATQNEMERLRQELNTARRDYSVMNKIREGVEKERDAALEREAALAAHMERLREGLHQALIHWGASCTDEDGKAYAECEKRCDETPTTSLARRDLLKKAEALDNLAGSLTLCFDGNVIDKPSILRRADELRQQATQ